MLVSTKKTFLLPFSMQSFDIMLPIEPAPKIITFSLGLRLIFSIPLIQQARGSVKQVTS